MVEPTSVDCLIIGAGMAGLSAAHRLRSHGCSIALLDKGRGVGGRLATRWREREAGGRAYFDHGAQFFTVRSPIFQSFVEQWQRDGLVREWSRGFAGASTEPHLDGHARYVVEGGMNALARHLASSLPVSTGTQVTAIRPIAPQGTQTEGMKLDGRGGWAVDLASGETWTTPALLLTPPVPQSLDLLAAGSTDLPELERESLRAIKYDPCLALLVELDRPSRLPDPGALQWRGEPIAWIGDNHRKGISAEIFTVTIHASPSFSRTHWETPSEWVAAQLLEAAADWMAPESVQHWQLHRWRYSHPLEPFPAPCLRLDHPAPLLFAGDAFGQPRVEGAFLSGYAAANALLGLDPTV
jgi:renalase